MSNGLVSIIVPIYKVERFLDRCITSLVEQTYQNIEIILIDDGSPDHCPQICDEWAQKDDRIRVIHKENGGLSEARNTGLDVSTGEYVVFVDSDDYVDREYVAYLYELLVNNNADIGICALCYETVDGHRIDGIEDTGRIHVMGQCQALKISCDCSLFSNSAWAKIYPRSFFDTIRFPAGHIYEDLAICYQLFLKAETIAFGERSLYHYIRNENSITLSTFSWKRLDEVTYGEEMCEGILSHWPELKGTVKARLLAIYASCWQSALFSRQDTKEIHQLMDELYVKIKCVRKELWNEKMAPRLRCYLISSLFGKKGMEFGFRVERKLFQLIKLR